MALPRTGLRARPRERWQPLRGSGGRSESQPKPRESDVTEGRGGRRPAPRCRFPAGRAAERPARRFCAHGCREMMTSPSANLTNRTRKGRMRCRPAGCRWLAAPRAEDRDGGGVPGGWRGCVGWLARLRRLAGCRWLAGPGAEDPAPADGGGVSAGWRGCAGRRGLLRATETCARRHEGPGPEGALGGETWGDGHVRGILLGPPTLELSTESILIPAPSGPKHAGECELRLIVSGCDTRHPGLDVLLRTSDAPLQP
jgi:hypothetical protein